MTLIVVSGAIANKLDQGGEAWVRLSYVLGLRRLGYDVRFLEQITPQACVDSDGARAPFEASANRAYFAAAMRDFGLSDCAALLPIHAEGRASVPRELLALADAADALLNISGHLAIEPLLQRFRNKIFIDIDPGFTQFWHAQGNPGARLAGHDFYFTIGENIGQHDCSIPTGDIVWRKTRPPVVLSEWPVTPRESEEAVRNHLPERPKGCFAQMVPDPFFRFTTIANWRGSFGPVEFGGQTFGLKVHEFRKFLELPARVGCPFEIALNIHPGDHKDLQALLHHGWRISKPRQVASTPDAFRTYVQGSAAEFSVAQGIYVQTGSGWFSDRTVRYLASGKPVLVQETGFSRNLPAGQGLVAFCTLDEAVRGAESIAADYAAHSQAARAIAEQCFDSDKVLGRMMEEIGIRG